MTKYYPFLVMTGDVAVMLPEQISFEAARTEIIQSIYDNALGKDDMAPGRVVDFAIHKTCPTCFGEKVIYTSYGLRVETCETCFGKGVIRLDDIF